MPNHIRLPMVIAIETESRADAQVVFFQFFFVPILLYLRETPEILSGTGNFLESTGNSNDLVEFECGLGELLLPCGPNWPVARNNNSRPPRPRAGLIKHAGVWQKMYSQFFILNPKGDTILFRDYIFLCVLMLWEMKKHKIK